MADRDPSAWAPERGDRPAGLTPQDGAGLKDWIKRRLEVLDAAARPWAARSPWRAFGYEFLLFGLKQAWASLFGGAMLGLLIGSHFLWPDPAPIARYDALVVAALVVQLLLLITRAFGT